MRNWNADHRFADEIVWMLVPELMSIVCKMKNLAQPVTAARAMDSEVLHHIIKSDWE